MRNILLLLFFALSPIFATAASTSPLTEENQEIVTPEQLVDEQTDWKTPTEQYKTSFIRTVLLIFGIIFLVIIVIWVLRRMGGTKPMMSNHYKNIKILERRALSPQTILYQVEIGGRQVIISESKVQVSALTEFDTLDKGKEL
jgi:flagellar protein FliO/FliZ